MIATRLEQFRDFNLSVLPAQLQIHASLSSNLLQLPLLCELLIQLLQILNAIGARLDDGILGAELSIGLNTQLDAGEERVRGLVCGEEDVW